MDPFDYLLAAPFALLALGSLPCAPLRRLLLYLLHRGGHMALVAGVLACAVFAFFPAAAPQPLRALPAFAAPDDWPKVAWLVKACMLLLVGLPLLAHLEYARELAAHTAYLRTLRANEVAPVVGASSSALADNPKRPTTANAAVPTKAMPPGDGAARSAPGPRKLVWDSVPDHH